MKGVAMGQVMDEAALGRFLSLTFVSRDYPAISISLLWALINWAKLHLDSGYLLRRLRRSDLNTERPSRP